MPALVFHEICSIERWMVLENSVITFLKQCPLKCLVVPEEECHLRLHPSILFHFSPTNSSELRQSSKLAHPHILLLCIPLQRLLISYLLHVLSLSNQKPDFF